MKINKGNTIKRKSIGGYATAIYLLPSITMHIWDDGRKGIQLNFLFWWVNIQIK